MLLRNYFFPRVIKVPDTKNNRNISISMWAGEPTVVVDGLIESGTIMRHIWNVGLTKLIPQHIKPKKVLLLGLAGGSNARLVNTLYPEAEITAVEIDPEIVEIGKKYCGLSKIKNMKIVISDALDFTNSLEDSFDICLVDCFEGKYIPKKLEDLDFFSKLKSQCRFVLINRLWNGEHLKASQNFINALSSKFFLVKEYTGTNVVISIVA